MAKIKFIYKKDPDDTYDRSVALAYEVPIDLTMEGLCDLFCEFASVLGYPAETINKFITFEENRLQ